MFENFDFSALEDPEYKEDAVREDLVAPLLKALGYQSTGKQRMQRSQSLVHPFVMIGSQRKKIHIIPDYTLWFGKEAVLVLDAKRPTESLVKSHHVEQAFSYAIHPEIRTKSYALCNGRKLVLYDIDRSEPVCQFRLDNLKAVWTDLLKHFSPEALINRHHREFLGDLGIFLRNAGFTANNEITFPSSRIQMLGRTLGGSLTAGAGHEMSPGASFQGSFDMSLEFLPALVSCLPEQVAKMVCNALVTKGSPVWVGGVVEVSWIVGLGTEAVGLYQHDPLVPLVVRVLNHVSLASPTAPPPDLPSNVLNVPTLLAYL